MYIGSEHQKINSNRIKFEFSFSFFVCFWALWVQFQAAFSFLCFMFGRLWICWGDDE